MQSHNLFKLTQWAIWACLDEYKADLIPPKNHRMRTSKPFSDISEVFQSLCISIISFYCGISVLCNYGGNGNAASDYAEPCRRGQEYIY